MLTKTSRRRQRGAIPRSDTHQCRQRGVIRALIPTAEWLRLRRAPPGGGRIFVGGWALWRPPERLRDPARSFYERLGGVYVRMQPITIGSTLLQEVSYGWKSLDAITY